MGGPIAETFERGFVYLPAMILVAKITPPGIESTMYSLAVTALALSQFLIRNSAGVLINDNFVHVDNAHMENYAYLKVITIVTSFLPLTYMWWLIPTLKEADDVQKEYAKQNEEQLELIEVQEA